MKIHTHCVKDAKRKALCRQSVKVKYQMKAYSTKSSSSFFFFDFASSLPFLVFLQEKVRQSYSVNVNV